MLVTEYLSLVTLLWKVRTLLYVAELYFISVQLKNKEIKYLHTKARLSVPGMAFVPYRWQGEAIFKKKEENKKDRRKMQL